MEQPKTNILLCEDDANLALVICEFLRAREYLVDHVTTCQESIEALLTKAYDLCLIDLTNEQEALDVLHQLRDSGNIIPAIVLLSRNEKDLIINMYAAGCNDYAIKPISMDILLCKIKAWEMRAEMEEENQETVFQLGNATFDSVRQLLGKKRLSGRENDLLLMLCRKTNLMVPRSQILRSLWQVDNYFSSRSLSVYINHLRHQLEGIKGVRIIAVHGKGYKLIVE